MILGLLTLPMLPSTSTSVELSGRLMGVDWIVGVIVGSPTTPVPALLTPPLMSTVVELIGLEVGRTLAFKDPETPKADNEALTQSVS